MKVISFVFFLHTILCASALYGQKQYIAEIDSLNRALPNAHDTLKVKILDQLVRRYFSVNENTKMYNALNDLERLSANLNSQEGLFKTAYYHGLISFNIEWQPSKALMYLHGSLKLGSDYKIEDPETYSAIYNNLGLIHKNIEQFDSAFYYYEKAAYLNKTHHLNGRNVTLLLNMCRMSYTIGNTALAQNYAEKCLSAAIEENDEKLICTGYKTMAEFLYYSESTDLAMEYCQRALNLSTNIYGKAHSHTASIINLFFKLHYRLGNYQQSLMYANQEFHSLRQIYGSSVHPKLSGSFLSLGRCHFRLSNYDSAEYFYKKALESVDMIPDKGNSAKLIVYNMLANCNLFKNDFEKAKKYLELALNTNVNNIGQQSEVRKLLGDLYFKSGDYTESLEEYQKALLIRAGKSLSDEYSNPPSEKINNHSRGLLLMQNTAAVHEALYTVTNKPEHLIASIKAYQICDTLVSDLRHNYHSDEDKVMFNNASVKVFNGGVRVADQLYHIFGEEKYKVMAFAFSEKAKSNLLYQSIAKQNAMHYSMLPDSVLNYEEALKGKIAFYISRIDKASEVSAKETYEDQLFKAERAYDNFQKELEDKFPGYYNLKYHSYFQPLPEIQEKLNGNVIIEYVLTDQSIYIFLIRDESSRIIKLAKPKALDQWIDDLRKAILSKEYEQYQDIAYTLYKNLFEPIKPYLDKEDDIIIIPDGKLWYLNFDLLLQAKEAGKPFYALDYLINDYTISYANSANHLFINEGLSKDNIRSECLAFSYSSDSLTTSSMDFLVLRDFKHDLPGTREEIRNISRLLPGKYYFGDLASEANFKKESQHYSILHLALHGEVSDKNPLYSKLKFSQTESDTTEDGYLNVYEIYNMSLNSELAVLSACNTGYGKLEKGEGLMSLGRAFQYAGVNSLLISNWGVPDEVAPSIMYDFYKNLKQGMKKSEALRNAKLNYLKTAGIHKSAPFYWGSFVVIGDTSPIDIKDDIFSNWVYFLMVISLFAGVLIVSVHGSKSLS